jgi:hypothetical protein
MDAMRTVKDAGGSSLKSMQTYYGIRNSPHNAATSEMPGDSNHHGIRDIGDTLKQGFTALAAAIRLMSKADPMETSDDFFYFANKGSDWFMGKEARCLDAYALLCFEKLAVFEAKYGPINFDIY